MSVALELRSGEDEALLEDAEVTFTLDEGPQREPEHAEAGRFDLAIEEDGRFDVTVTAPGHEVVTRSYDIGLTSDGCHVEGVTETLVLATEE